jgi:hypothetical protein
MIRPCALFIGCCCPSPPSPFWGLANVSMAPSTCLHCAARQLYGFACSEQVMFKPHVAWDTDGGDMAPFQYAKVWEGGG